MHAAEVHESIATFKEYLSDRLGASERTIKAYSADVRSFARFLADELKNDECAVVIQNGALPPRFVAWLRNSAKNGPATIRRKLISIGTYCRWRVLAGRSEHSPFEDARIVVRLPKRLPRALPRCDVTVLLAAGEAASRSVQDPDTSLALRLLLATGLRISEMCAIDAADIARDGRAIRIKGKGNRERTVFVGNEALRNDIAALAARRIRSLGPLAPLFQNRDKARLTPQAFRLRLHQLTEDSGIAGRVTPHRLRHTAATLLIEEGVDIRLVQKLLGHASIATTEIYTHVADASLAAALDRADPLRHVQR